MPSRAACSSACSRACATPDVFVTVEKWDSMESLESHLASDHLASALARTEDLLATAPQIIPAQPLAVGEPAKSTY